MSGVGALIDTLLETQSFFGLEHVAASKRLPDGHTLTLRVFGDSGLLEIERDDGELVLVRPPE